MAKITRVCDGCKKLLRKAEMYEPLSDSRFKKLCKDCFDLWLDDKLEVKK